ncbi:hypothetical protein [Leptolyngbya phage Lbo-JY46]
MTAFDGVSTVRGTCSMITLFGINKKRLRKYKKLEILTEVVMQTERQKRNVVRNTPGDLRSIKVIQITLNTTRFWSLFTPWKFAYSYKGNAGFCSVFYLKVK